MMIEETQKIEKICSIYISITNTGNTDGGSDPAYRVRYVMIYFVIILLLHYSTISNTIITLLLV